MKTKLIIGLAAVALATPALTAELHIAVNGSDDSSGARKSPLRTIQHAAELAQPGDVITVHEGIYRERVNPPRGGTSDASRIVYQSAPGEHVEIKGSEIVKGWTRVQDDVWQVTLLNSFFGGFNPYSDLIHGDWFDPKKREHHTGAVYLNGEWLTEAANLADVLKPVGEAPLWFGRVDATNTTLWAQFKGVNPNEQLVEINIRQTVFYPDKPGRNFIAVRGFTMRDAATPWSPPTAEQIGLIGTHWSKGWIIESNNISHSICAGVSLGKYGDAWDNRAWSAVGYVGTINRALTNGWNSATIGHHLVRNNEISHCEQAGIVGSLGCAFSSITGNTVHDIHVRRLFTGAEMAGIKFHGAIDTEISGNHIYHTVRGLWLDWMAQGTRVSRNLFHENANQDLFVEVNHGPFVVDNNIFLSRTALHDVSEGGAYVHNLFTGKITSKPDLRRDTPFHPAHDTPIAGMYPAGNGDSGDHRFYNNLLMGSCSLSALDHSMLACFYAGNVFTKGTQPAKSDDGALLQTNFDAGVKLTQKADGWYLMLAEDDDWRAAAKCKLVTTDGLGLAKVSGCAFENADGSPVKIDTDYFGRARDGKNPFPGPFEKPADARREIKVWPLARK